MMGPASEVQNMEQEIQGMEKEEHAWYWSHGLEQGSRVCARACGLRPKPYFGHTAYVARADT